MTTQEAVDRVHVWMREWRRLSDALGLADSALKESGLQFGCDDGLWWGDRIKSLLRIRTNHLGGWSVIVGEDEIKAETLSGVVGEAAPRVESLLSGMAEEAARVRRVILAAADVVR